jgi:hypothetical protein
MMIAKTGGWKRVLRIFYSFTQRFEVRPGAIACPESPQQWRRNELQAVTAP